jgi:hypothetical protein
MRSAQRPSPSAVQSESAAHFGVKQRSVGEWMKLLGVQTVPGHSLGAVQAVATQVL